MEPGFFSVVTSEKARGNGYNLKYRRFPLDITKYSFTLRVTEPWHRLPREAVAFLSLEILKNHPITILGK